MRPKLLEVEDLPNPPIGLGYIASILNKHGHKVDIIDCAISRKSYPQIASDIKSINPDIIGITALSSYYDQMRILSSYLHKLEIPLILGGVHVTALPELSLRECKVDYVVIGEGELTILELMEKWNNVESRKKINGIAYLENDKFILNPARELIKNLDDIPFPDWHQINPLKYPPEPHGVKMNRYPVAPILTTRGCPYSCTYCASVNFWGKKFRRRSPQNVVDEIEYLVNEFGIREIHIWDDNFTLVRKHVVGVCWEIIRRKLDITIACPNGVRIDSLNKSLLTIMRRAGFWSLTFAIESGAQTVLNKVNKKLNSKIIPEKAKLAKSLGYCIPSYFIFGLPGETYTTARQSIQLMKNIPLDSIICFVAKPLPGSELFTKWMQDQEACDIDYDWFHFYKIRNVLELTDGKRKLTLPLDAYREFHLRPIQILRYLKYQIKTFHRKQLPKTIRRFFSYILNRDINLM